jgi:uroporphyrinogen-III synthase
MDQGRGAKETDVRLLLTRPSAPSLRFAAAARERLGAGLAVTIAPLQRIVPVGALPPMAGIAGLILSSESGAEAYAALGGPAGLRAWCVGDRTTRAALAAGLMAEMAGADAEGLVARLATARPEGLLLHLHGRHTAGRIAERLLTLGLQVRGAVLYDQQALPLSPEGQAVLAAPGPLLVPVFSRRSADLLVPWLREARAALRLAAISPAVAEALDAPPGAVTEIAARPDGAAMMDALYRLQACVSP